MGSNKLLQQHKRAAVSGRASQQSAASVSSGIIRLRTFTTSAMPITVTAPATAGRNRQPLELFAYTVARDSWLWCSSEAYAGACWPPVQPTDLNSTVPTAVLGSMGVNTKWLRGDTTTTSKASVSIT
jgi:hypothetical protein